MGFQPGRADGRLCSTFCTVRATTRRAPLRAPRSNGGSRPSRRRLRATRSSSTPMPSNRAQTFRCLSCATVSFPITIAHHQQLQDGRGTSARRDSEARAAERGLATFYCPIHGLQLVFIVRSRECFLIGTSDFLISLNRLAINAQGSLIAGAFTSSVIRLWDLLRDESTLSTWAEEYTGQRADLSYGRGRNKAC